MLNRNLTYKVYFLAINQTIITTLYTDTRAHYIFAHNSNKY